MTSSQLERKSVPQPESSEKKMTIEQMVEVGFNLVKDLTEKQDKIHTLALFQVKVGKKKLLDILKRFQPVILMKEIDLFSTSYNMERVVLDFAISPIAINVIANEYNSIIPCVSAEVRKQLEQLLVFADFDLESVKSGQPNIVHT